MKRIIAMMLALMMVFALCACGNDSSNDDKTKDDVKTLVVGIDPEYPPYAYMGDDGKYTGFDVETAQAVCDLLGWKVEFFALNWDQKLVQLDSKECDCIWAGMTILDSMKKAGYVISKPYYDNTQVLLVKSDSGYTSSKDLAGKTVAVQLGTSGQTLLDGDLADLKATFKNVVTCNSFLSCFTSSEAEALTQCSSTTPLRLHMPQKTRATPSSTRTSAQSSTVLHSAPATRNCATRFRALSISSLKTAPIRRSPISIPTS